MRILAIETSCDETSVSILEDEKVLSNVISSQIDIHKQFGGVVPEIASRHHIRNISYIYKEALNKANVRIEDIDYIAYTETPGLIGSLLVGIMFAKGLSNRYNIPLIPVNHIVGHIYSNFIENPIHLPCIHLVASGGHTSLYLMNEKMELKLIGQTLDDAIGEAYDKIARILDLEYPGGPKIDKIACEYEKRVNIEEYKPLILNKKPNVANYDFSFSGIKTKVLNYVNTLKMKKEKIDVERICYEVQKNLITFIDDKVYKAIKDYNIKYLYISGGVSANQGLRNYFKKYEGINVYFPSLIYCTDNAAMIAKAAMQAIKN